MTTTELETRTRAILEQEDAARLERARTTAADAIAQEHAEQERQTKIAALRTRLEALQATSFEKERQRADAALDAYAAALVAYNAEVHAIQGELMALGPLPRDVEPAHGRGVKIGPVAVGIQRLQARIADLAHGVVRRHQPRGFISLDNPND